MDAYAAPAGDAFRAPKCTPVTLYQSEEKPPAESASSQLAACEGFLAYAIKGGKIRVLARGSATRTLLRGHSQRIVDLAFGGGAAAKGQVDDALGVAAEQRASCRPPSQDADLAALDRIRQEAFAGGELGRRGLGGGLLLALVQRHRRALGRAEGVASRGGVRVHGFYSRSASYRR